MANPLYGQNKADASLDFGKQIKVIHFRLLVVASGEDGDLTDNLDTGVVVPAGFLPLYSVVKNDGATALASGAKTCDVGGTDLSGSLASLAAGAEIKTIVNSVLPASDTAILIDGNTRVASSTTVLDWKIYGYDTASVDDSSMTRIQ
tara:strand:- start:888 stop:1328 length:441 start_codon:yes stop_codon:yes gene_type:complete